MYIHCTIILCWEVLKIIAVASAQANKPLTKLQRAHDASVHTYQNTKLNFIQIAFIFIQKHLNVWFSQPNTELKCFSWDLFCKLHVEKVIVLF